VVIVAAEMAGGIFAILYRGRLEQEIQRELTTVVQQHYVHQVNSSHTVWGAVSAALDKFMLKVRAVRLP
jgi:hypothetical protein